ncbi:MAG: photosystem II biogenesis protein Psp29 [cyanobacterium endosymbiont of Rhopalodia musculus]|uniref:photosystem II biogenesis protein Psp29 n=1 Tax=cyanobacterium endosymbiont of Epithemia clementina EcSB TaxID=3034674 RepID=UPI002480901C|nr:photosystem II biogenesis protein Psp29 [cyanobacterium endosymbiont of Epithemia clementina EcSB]WGT67895.1 photosystem II biogenesis protein Psp29 [cyanobacterium endosymbiont of Epithemia clementina EcSB]
MDKVRTVSDTKRDFYTHHAQPINSIYRRFIEELLVEMHLLSVNVDFRYDPIYALGVVTSFERFVQGYRPQKDKDSIFSALCYSVGGNAEQYRQEAQTLLTQVKGMSVSDFMRILKAANSQVPDDGILGETLQAIAQNSQFKYSRLFTVGLYTLIMELDFDLVENKEKRNQIFGQIAEVLHLSSEKLQKDLELYRSNLDKMEQLLAVVEDALEAGRKKRKQATQQTQTTDSSVNLNDDSNDDSTNS